jgi:CheY-like chemotaxis protein
MVAKIMLVEDDINLSEIYKARLEAEGYQISSAKDGEEALALAVKEHPNLIISDIMMPNISGFDMLDILRSTPGIEATKVIMMTALGQAEDKTRAEKLGADRYLVKSQVTLEDVVKVVREVLESDKPGGFATPKADISAAAPEQPALTSAATMPVTTTPVTQPNSPAPVTIADPVMAPAPSPVSPPLATAAPNTASNQPLLDTKPAVPTPLPVADNSSTVDSTLGQSSIEETSNIKSQIQDFLNPTPADVASNSPAPVTADPATAPALEQRPENSYVNIPGKKTISTDFINAKPDIYSLLAKEEGPQEIQTPNQATEPTNNIDPNSISL